mmetsp:Transcript_26894/g.88261  ORF Transcript_26894/g.88261 Transcript_26894/m.88261 type:complete len:278 (-) Transcript_26894:69-902(-)
MTRRWKTTSLATMRRRRRRSSAATTTSAITRPKQTRLLQMLQRTCAKLPQRRRARVPISRVAAAAAVAAAHASAKDAAKAALEPRAPPSPVVCTRLASVSAGAAPSETILTSAYHTARLTPPGRRTRRRRRCRSGPSAACKAWRRRRTCTPAARTHRRGEGEPRKRSRARLSAEGRRRRSCSRSRCPSRPSRVPREPAAALRRSSRWQECPSMDKCLRDRRRRWLRDMVTRSRSSSPTTPFHRHRSRPTASPRDHRTSSEERVRGSAQGCDPSVHRG